MASQIPGLKFSFEVSFRAAGEGGGQGSAVQNSDAGHSPRPRAPGHGAAAAAGEAGERHWAAVPTERKNEIIK